MLSGGNTNTGNTSGGSSSGGSSSGGSSNASNTSGGTQEPLVTTEENGTVSVGTEVAVD